MDTEAAFCCIKMKRDAVVEEGMWVKVEVGVTHCSLTLQTGVWVPSELLCQWTGGLLDLTSIDKKVD